MTKISRPSATGALRSRETTSGSRFRRRLLATMVVAVLMACGTESADVPASPGESEASSPTSASAILPGWCENLPRPAYADLERVPVSGDWFQVYVVGDGVFAIYEPNQWQEVISYLVLGEERALLFDSGMGIAPISEVVAGLTGGLPVTVLNSHTHLDHIGGNAEFADILAMDTEYTRNRSRGLPNESVREEVLDEALCAPLPEGVTVDSYATRPFSVAEFITDGHRIDLGGRTLEVLHIPGHTPDAVALYDAEAGYLWTGDSFYEAAIWLFAEETDLEAYRRAVARMADLVPELERVFPAHNTPVSEPVRLLELRDALEGAIAGTLEGEPADEGLVRYEAGRFSLLMRSR